MERNPPRTSELSSVLAKRLSSASADNGRLSNCVDPGRDAILRSSGTGPGLTTPKIPAPNSSAEGVFVPSESLRDQLLAIRRRLWIVNATLESLPAKIEQTYSRRSSILGGASSSRVRNTSNPPCQEVPAREPHEVAGGCWARWRRAKLRSRASRAERLAAAALYNASISFGDALEAVLRAAVARVKADEASFQSFPNSAFSERHHSQ
jgi:hypothetical protein